MSGLIIFMNLFNFALFKTGPARHMKFSEVGYVSKYIEIRKNIFHLNCH